MTRTRFVSTNREVMNVVVKPDITAMDLIVRVRAIYTNICPKLFYLSMLLYSHLQKKRLAHGFVVPPIRSALRMTKDIPSAVACPDIRKPKVNVS